MSEPEGFTEGRVWAVCDRCGKKLPHAELRKEWTGLMVGPCCYDPKPDDLSPPRVDPKEGAPIVNPRPRPPDVFVSQVEFWETLDGFQRWMMMDGQPWTTLG